MMVKRLLKYFKASINELKNTLSTLLELGSEVSHFIPEPSNFAEFTRLPADAKNDQLKTSLKYIKNSINNQKFLLDDPDKGYPVTPFMDVYKAKNQYDASIKKLK